MTYYDDIYEHAVGNYYLISTEDARELGIPGVELAKLAYRGRLESISRGLYRLSRYVPSERDAYAIAVARVGRDARLYGESVIAMLSLAPTNPDCIYVATPARTRKNLPRGIGVVRVSDEDPAVRYEGIPSQKVKDAILACKETMMPDRLRDAAEKAHREGYLTSREMAELERRFVW